MLKLFGNGTRSFGGEVSRRNHVAARGLGCGPAGMALLFVLIGIAYVGTKIQQNPEAALVLVILFAAGAVGWVIYRALKERSVHHVAAPAGANDGPPPGSGQGPVKLANVGQYPPPVVDKVEESLREGRAMLAQMAAERAHAVAAEVRVRCAALSQQFGPEIGERLSRWELRLGDTREMVIACLGPPVATEDIVLKTKRKQILKWKRISANRFGVKITIVEGVVVGWDKK